MRVLASSLAAIFLLLTPALARGAPRTLLVANDSSLAIENTEANYYHLSRMRNYAMILQYYRAGYLVRVPASTSFYYLDGVPPEYRYLRPWSKLFLDRLSQEFYARFRQRLRITSLIRTVESQFRLVRTNPNAAEAIGPDRSSHLTGATFDISKRFMSFRARQWIRRVLFSLRQARYLDAIEEFQEPCFHVMVYPTYQEYVARLTTHRQPVPRVAEGN